MDKRDASEQAYKNGYSAGYEAGRRSVGEQKWIPVTERLPKKFGEYIVAVKAASGVRYSDYADYDLSQQRWRTGLCLCVRDKVTHWMPLPAPPNCGADMRGEEDGLQEIVTI